MAKITTTSNAALDLEPHGTGDINLTPGANGDVNIPANKGLTFASDTEKIESNDTDLTVNSGGAINLTATTDVVIPADVGVTFGTGEKIEGNDTDLTLTSGGDIDLTATNDVVIPVNVGLVLGDGGEKIESNNTDLTVTSGGDIILDAGGADVTLKDGGTTFGSLKQASGHLVIQPTSSKEIILNDQGGTAALTVDTANQNVSINNGNIAFGTAGKGIDFSGAQTPAGETTDEVLSGYEEGFHDVTVGSTGGGSCTLDEGSDKIGYTKIGNTVFCTGFIGILVSSLSNGAMNLTLPFQSSSATGNRSGFYVLLEGSTASNLSDFVGTISASSSSLTIYLGDNRFFQGDTAQDVDGDSGLFLSFFYTTV